MDISQIIVIIIAALLVLFYVLWQLKKKGYRQIIIDLIVLAERNLVNGQVKFEYVVTGFINKLPFPANLIPVSLVSKFVQNVFDEIKIALDYQKEDH